MNEAFNMIFTQEFLLRALIVGVLISLCSALLGVSLVLKRFSMIGDGLSHLGFGAMAIACAANIAPLYFALPIVIVAAFMLLRMSENGKIKGDAAIALISTGALAVGVMATSLTTGMNIDIYNYMFGSILTMTKNDVLISGILSVVVIILFAVFYNEIFAVTFDESFAKATGTNTSFYNMLIAALTAVTIVIGMRMMGALLISSLIIFPTVTSMKICKSFRSVILSGTAVSVFCFITGLFLSVKYATPTGATVVCVNIYTFIFFTVIKFLKGECGNSRLKKAIFFTILIILGFVYSVVMLAGNNNYNAENNGKVKIVTTTFAQYDFARNVAGDKGEVSMLLAPGEESHTYEPTPEDILKIERCDLFIYGGGESEKWADSILESSDGEMHTIKMMETVELYEEAHSEEHNHSHEETEYDEHVWTSPYNAVKIVEAICLSLSDIDEKNSDFYSDSAENYIEQLEELDENFKTVVKNGSRKEIVVGDRFPLRYLTERYGIEYYSAFPGCSAQTEANPKTISALIDIINKNSIPTVFKVDLGSGKIAESISESTGAVVDTLYSCHVISAEDYINGEGYISLMERNLENLKSALN